MRTRISLSFFNFIEGIYSILLPTIQGVIARYLFSCIDYDANVLLILCSCYFPFISVDKRQEYDCHCEMRVTTCMTS